MKMMISMSGKNNMTETYIISFPPFTTVRNLLLKFAYNCLKNEELATAFLYLANDS